MRVVVVCEIVPVKSNVAISRGVFPKCYIRFDAGSNCLNCTNSVSVTLNFPCSDRSELPKQGKEVAKT